MTISHKIEPVAIRIAMEGKNMIISKKPADKDECNCVFYAKLVGQMGDGFNRYICKRCGLKFFSSELLKEHSLSEAAPNQEYVAAADGDPFIIFPIISSFSPSQD